MLKTVRDNSSFISLLKDYIISASATIIIFYLNLDLTLKSVDGAKNLVSALFGNIVIIPFYIILFLVATCIGLHTFFKSIKILKNADKMIIKIMSSIILILTIAMLIILIFLTLQLFGVI